MRTHPQDEDLWALGRGAHGSDGLARHVASCPRCTGEVRFVEVLACLRGPGPSPCPSPCPCAEDVVLFADGMLRDDAVAAHVAGCAACARQIESLQRAPEPDALGSRWPGIVRGIGEALDGGRKAVSRQVGEAFDGGRKAVERAISGLAVLEMPPCVELATRSSRAVAGNELMRGLARYRRGELDAARRDLELALAGGERAPELRFFLAALLRRDGLADEAAEMLETVVAELPRVPDYRWHLAQARLDAGRGAEALAQLLRVARMPGSRRAAAREQARRVAEALQREDPRGA